MVVGCCLGDLHWNKETEIVSERKKESERECVSVREKDGKAKVTMTKAVQEK